MKQVIKKLLAVTVAAILMVSQVAFVSFAEGESKTFNAYDQDVMCVPNYSAQNTTDEIYIEVTGKGSISDSGYCVQDTGSGTVIMLKSVDFGDTGAGMAYFRASTGNSSGYAVEVRLDSADGTLLANLSCSTETEGGWSGDAKQVSAEAATLVNPTGVHDLYIVRSSGYFNFYGIYFTEKSDTDAPAVSVDAYDSDKMRVPWFGMGVDWLDGSGLGLMTVENATDGDYCVTGISSETVITIDNVKFGDNGPTHVYIEGNTGSSDGFTAELRLDSPTGTLLATLDRQTATDGGWSSGVENVAAEADITASVTGYHSICIVYTRGAMNFYGIYFDESDTPAAPTVSVNAYNPDEMRVPWFGIGVDWLEGSGLNLLTVSEEATNGDYCTTGITTGTVLSIANVNFGEVGAGKVYIRGNSGNETGFAADIRLDSIDGPVIATVSRSDATAQGWSGGADEVAAVSQVNQKITGYHTVYIVYSAGAMNFFGLHFDKLGDVNGDGTVAAADLIVVRQHILGISESVAADINFDGTVDIKDLVRLKKLTA